MPFYEKDLSMGGFWYRQASWNQSWGQGEPRDNYTFVSLGVCFSSCGLKTSVPFRRNTGSLWGGVQQVDVQEPPLPSPDKAAPSSLDCVLRG